MDVVLADQLCGVSLVNGALQRLALADELATDIDIAGMGAHRERGDQAAFDQRMRVVAHDVAILAGARLGLVCIDDEIMRPFLHFFRHEGPLQAGGKSGAAASAQARLLHDVDDDIGPQIDDGLGVVPLAALLRRLEAGALETVKVGEDAILVGEHQVAAPGGFCFGASRSEAAWVGFLASASAGGGGGGGALGTYFPMMEPS